MNVKKIITNRLLTSIGVLFMLSSFLATAVSNLTDERKIINLSNDYKNLYQQLEGSKKINIDNVTMVSSLNSENRDLNVEKKVLLKQIDSLKLNQVKFYDLQLKQLSQQIDSLKLRLLEVSKFDSQSNIKTSIGEINLIDTLRSPDLNLLISLGGLLPQTSINSVNYHGSNYSFDVLRANLNLSCNPKKRNISKSSISVNARITYENSTLYGANNYLDISLSMNESKAFFGKYGDSIKIEYQGNKYGDIFNATFVGKYLSDTTIDGKVIWHSRTNAVYPVKLKKIPD